MAHFLLVHGAWHGAWCWSELAPLLRQAGHSVIAPDLPGMGADRTPIDQVSVDSWARFLVAAAAQAREPVILVAHSRAGLVASQAAEYAPDAYAAIVYLAAFLPAPGQTLLELMRSMAPRPESAGSLMIAADNATSVIAPDAFARVFYNTTAPALIERAAALSCPEPMTSFTTPARTSEGRWGRVPRYYIECAEDRAIAPALQRAMYARTPCRRVFTLGTDHSPFFSAPRHLAAILDQIASGRDERADGARPLSRDTNTPEETIEER